MKEQKRCLPSAPDILKSEKCVKYANEMIDDVIHSTPYYTKYIIELTWPICSTDHWNWQANISRRNTPTVLKNCFHGNSLFSSPHSFDFNMSMIVSSKNVTPGHKLEITDLYVCTRTLGSCTRGTISKYQVTSKAFSIGNVWNQCVAMLSSYCEAH